MKEVGLFFLFCVSFGSAFSRTVDQTLAVNNGGNWGTWRQAEFCPPGEYAYGYRMRLQKWQGHGDDTALNAIQLVCRDGTKITSGAGELGDWSQTFTKCRPSEYLVAFSLQVEAFQGSGLSYGKDDSAANFVKFLCRNYNGGDTEEKAEAPGTGEWGEYGDWSPQCEEGSAICGLETRVEAPQGLTVDNTALNDVRFLCCSD